MRYANVWSDSVEHRCDWFRLSNDSDVWSPRVNDADDDEIQCEWRVEYQGCNIYNHVPQLNTMETQ